jgi:hypothetical protein
VHLIASKMRAAIVLRACARACAREIIEEFLPTPLGPDQQVLMVGGEIGEHGATPASGYWPRRRSDNVSLDQKMHGVICIDR